MYTHARVYIMDAQCFGLQDPPVQRHKHQRNANYAKGEPRCFATREPKLSLFQPLLVPHVPLSSYSCRQPTSASDCAEISDNFA